MPDRIYFLFGDLLSNCIIAGLAGAVSAALVNPGWNMFLAMLVCMLLGMLIAVVGGTFFFMRYFGAMEVMLPTMLGGMLAAMVAGMAAAMMPYAVLDAAKHGAAIGIAALLFCSYANYLIKGNNTQEAGAP